MIEVIQLERDYRDQVRLGKQLLRIRETHEGVTRVVLVEARSEDADQAKPLVARDQTERRELSLGAGHQHRIAHARANRFREILTDHNGRHRRKRARCCFCLWRDGGQLPCRTGPD